MTAGTQHDADVIGVVERRARRRPAVLAVLVLLGAAAAAGAAAMTWWTQAFADSLSGSITTKATGSQTDPLLIPVALVALAGFGAALATTGAVRRGVGALLALGGAAAAVLAVVGLFSAPGTLRSDLTRPADAVGAAQIHVFGPVLGALAGALVAAAGALVLAGFGARKGRRGLGSRYDAPSGRRTARRSGRADGTFSPGSGPAATANAGTNPSSALLSSTGPSDPAADPNAAAQWWKALDAGEDPTALDDADPGEGTARGGSTGVADGEPDPNDAGERPLQGPSTLPPGRSDQGVSDEVTRGG